VNDDASAIWSFGGGGRWLWYQLRGGARLDLVASGVSSFPPMADGCFSLVGGGGRWLGCQLRDGARLDLVASSVSSLQSVADGCFSLSFFSFLFFTKESTQKYTGVENRKNTGIHMKD
jgi:hypothetical protein